MTAEQSKLEQQLAKLHQQYMERLQADIPVLAAHGEQDNIVLIERGEKAVKLLQSKDMDIQWHTYPMAHSVCGEEVVDIDNLLKRVLESFTVYINSILVYTWTH